MKFHLWELLINDGLFLALATRGQQILKQEEMGVGCMALQIPFITKAAANLTLNADSFLQFCKRPRRSISFQEVWPIIGL